jgi:hypothetical protein
MQNNASVVVKEKRKKNNPSPTTYLSPRLLISLLSPHPSRPRERYLSSLISARPAQPSSD